MAATQNRRQTIPRWELARDSASAANAAAPTRGAKIIPFPGAAARNATVVTYPAQLVVPTRPIIDTVPPTTPRERRIGLVAALALAGTGALLLLV